MKICIMCGTEKPFDQYSSDKSRKDGLNNKCKECDRKKVRAYYKKHAKEMNRYSRQWYKDNIDRVRKWKKDNKESQDEYKRISRRKRRALKLKIEENYTKEDERYTRSLFNNCCANCGSTDNLTIDHHYPLSEGNALTRSNAVVLCGCCNSRKHTKQPQDFYSPEVLQFIEEKLGQIAS